MPSLPSMTDLSLTPALDLSMVELAALFNGSFEGYLIPVDIDALWMADRLRMDGIDLGASRVVRREGEATGLVLVARRGFTSRVAAMGLVAAVRGRGLGREILTRLANECRDRGERELILEVIEQNTPAVRLYQGFGFETVQRLVGFACTDSRPGTGEVEGGDLVEVDLHELGRLVGFHEPRDIPWQISGHSLSQLGLPHRGYALDGAYAAVSNPLEKTVLIKNVFVAPPQRREGRATRVVESLLARFPGRTWRVPALAPESVAVAFFSRLGFEQEKLSQLQMRLPLS